MEEAMESPNAVQIRAKLLAFYQEHAPEELAQDLHKVDNLLARVVGGPPTNVGGMMVGGVLWTEAELFEKLVTKYCDPEEKEEVLPDER
jgi:hypothetical protein